MTVAPTPQRDTLPVDPGLSVMDSRSDIDAASFRQALGRLAAGVAVVACVGPGATRVGVTVSSVTSVSLDPPLVLFCLDRNGGSAAAFTAADSFTINLLSAGQRDLSDLFARAGAKPWERVALIGEPGEPPVFDGALATLTCARWATYDGGDHVIVVGRVVAVAVRNDDPLLYWRGRYHHLGSALGG